MRSQRPSSVQHLPAEPAQVPQQQRSSTHCDFRQESHNNNDVNDDDVFDFDADEDLPLPEEERVPSYEGLQDENDQEVKTQVHEGRAAREGLPHLTELEPLSPMRPSFVPVLGPFSPGQEVFSPSGKHGVPWSVSILSYTLICFV